ncbi:hypothetical protein [Porphyromonas pogonae]|uniref:hypothetical protein n=1 Tax=Porphyromonas pogonae TaxID=867595 RepID=UPI002E794FF5|nr:hypothetical protein [Porphyromonas pogonae]
MKLRHLIFIGLLSLCGIYAAAQNDKYQQSMREAITQFKGLKSAQDLAALSNKFERIGNAEKTQWLPYYYAAYSNAIMALKKPAESEAGVKQALKWLDKAEELGGDKSETYCVRSYLFTATMLMDPVNRWSTDGVKAMDYLDKAVKINPSNPRPYLLQGQTWAYTPKDFGGGKDVALPLLNKSQELFKTFKPASELHPNWGEDFLQEIIKTLE